jgi:serine/threonine-protein kinase PknG
MTSQTAEVRCGEPGCTGTIAADGYCDTCGARYQANAAGTGSGNGAAKGAGGSDAGGAGGSIAGGLSAAAAPSVSTRSTPVGSICGRDGCVGTIAADGYCDVCGLAAASPGHGSGGSAPAAAGGSVSVAAGGTGSASTSSGSTVLDSSGDGVSASMRAPSLAVPEPPSVSSRVSGGAASAGVSRRTASSSVRTRSVRTGVGVGLVTVPETVVGDPAAAVMTEAEVQAQLGEVPEADRFCSSCGKPVGRGSNGRDGRVKGFCGSCRAPFDFVTNEPVLRAGELVGGQYRITGPLAHGGMGWIYLGADQAVSDRWVVLKGLLNENDPDAVAAAVAERRFLAEIEQANIVNIYNFVTHRGAGYIVMEMVGGESLNAKLKARRKANGGVASPLPVTDAIAYVLGILPALGYLHSRGLVYNDLKPANIMAVGDDVKLIDLGAVMRIDDHQAAIFGTPGFQAPEVAHEGPSVASDLFTVGRTLAVLILRFVFHAGPYEYSLPPLAEAPTLARWESLHRFLLRATAKHPDDRFQTAAEMEEQLTGVLREIVARTDGRPRPVASQIFEGDQLAELLVDRSALSDRAADYAVDAADWRVLPPTRIDEADPAAPFLLGLPERDPQRAAATIEAGIASGQIEASAEVQLRRVWELIKAAYGDEPAVETILRRIEHDNPWEWRVGWYRSIDLLRRGQAAAAAEGFSRVWTELPGERAPKLAVAIAAEVAGEYQRALDVYDAVIGADSSYVSAAFGMARCNRALRNHDAAVASYTRVPTTSAAHTSAQTAAVRHLITDGTDGQPSAADLRRAADTVERLQLDSRERAGLSSAIYEGALDALRDGRIQTQQGTVLGRQLDERSLRRGLEDAYRLQARLSDSSEERVRFIELANAVRPSSLF